MSSNYQISFEIEMIGSTLEPIVVDFEQPQTTIEIIKDSKLNLPYSGLTWESYNPWE